MERHLVLGGSFAIGAAIKRYMRENLVDEDYIAQALKISRESVDACIKLQFDYIPFNEYQTKVYKNVLRILKDQG